MLHYVDTSTGELIACPVYVAVLPFSGYGYVEALPDAKLPQVVKALNYTIASFGGVPLTVKSDNMRQWCLKVVDMNPYLPTCSNNGQTTITSLCWRIHPTKHVFHPKVLQQVSIY